MVALGLLSVRAAEIKTGRSCIAAPAPMALRVGMFSVALCALRRDLSASLSTYDRACLTQYPVAAENRQHQVRRQCRHCQSQKRAISGGLCHGSIRSIRSGISTVHHRYRAQDRVAAAKALSSAA
jgi:hypothetical protein